MELKPFMWVALAGALASLAVIAIDRPNEPDASIAETPAETVTEVAQTREMTVEIDPSFLEPSEPKKPAEDHEYYEVDGKWYPVNNQAFQDRTFVLPRVFATDDGKCVPIEMPVGNSRCWEEYGFNPYFQYDLDVLTSTAASDAQASAVLALMYRYEDPERSLFYALQATRLSDKPGPLYRYIQAVETNTEIDHLLDLYAVALYAENAGFELPISDQYRYWLRGEGLTDAEIDERMIDRRVVASLGEGQ